jgi:raffinose/stachyose/melibiose transport system permease protein
VKDILAASAPLQDVAGRRIGWTTPLSYLIGVLAAAVTVAPVVYVVVSGFRTTGEIAADPSGLPEKLATQNYTDVLRSTAFWQQIQNSLFIALATTLIVVACGSLAAFALARYAFAGREALYTLFTLGLLFPVGVAVLPLYLLLRNLDLLDSPWAVALPQAAFGLPLTIVILRPFMRQVPAELEDAAVIDGCGRFGFFWRILMPLSKPALLTVGIFAFVNSWNAYLLPLLLISDPEQYTLPLGTAIFSSQYSADTARILAFTALSMLPALAFFVLAERRMIGGLTGSVKG